MIPDEKLQSLRAEYEELEKRVVNPAEMGDQRGYRKLMRRFKELAAIHRCLDEIRQLEQRIADNREMIHEESDRELILMAQEDSREAAPVLEERRQEIRDLLAPRDPNDDKDAIVEIRAGTGGDEAALFAADLFRMYGYYAEKKGWSLALLSVNSIGIGGYKEVVFQLSGESVYGTMRFESGVHRVQRVPQTESSGRIHTSAVSVAVLPEADEIDVVVNDGDLRIDVFRATGHGGQSVNTTDSAVRITHLPSGLVVTCQDEKSQLKNKNKAMKVLRSRLLDLEIARREAEISRERRAQVGTGDRSAKIRTYNFPQSRVTDHRINLTSYRLNEILGGELDEYIDALKLAYKNEQMTS
ncbi:MAG: peptide chain release factor 1 [Candidatus Cloacimonetes bacterium]|nr:peptide chain release factor 1 [Candidatus Cloacimonadota bacterium]